MPQLSALALHRRIRPAHTFAAIALFLIATNPANARAETCFDDQKLAQLLSQSSAERGTLLYVWSPRMVYSVQNMALAARAAGAAGLDFVPVQEGGKSLEEPPAASLRLCSAQLIERQALRHFPTAFVISRHEVHRFPIVGAMPYEAWVSSIAQRLQKGSAAP